MTCSRASSRATSCHYIPGNPSAIVQNQPAAGGVVMINQLYALGPKDGTVIGVPINGMPTAPMLMSGTQFDSTKLIWIGSTNREAYVAFVWHTVAGRSITELADKELLVGATTPGTTMVDFPLLLNDVLGYKFKIVRGYQRHAADQSRDRARRDCRATPASAGLR